LPSEATTRRKGMKNVCLMGFRYPEQDGQRLQELERQKGKGSNSDRNVGLPHRWKKPIFRRIGGQTNRKTMKDLKRDRGEKVVGRRKNKTLLCLEK